MKLLCYLFLLGASLLPRLCAAQDFVYEPKNPAFGGGNTFNYSWLLSAATAQNTTTDPATTQQTTDPLNQFSANLNQQVLSQLTSRLISSQFGQGAIRAGSYNVGGYQVQVTPGSSGIVVVVTDTGNGNQTTVTIPNGL